MSVKDFIKCLTLILCLTPSKDVNASVKDILNNENTVGILSLDHEQEIFAHIIRFHSKYIKMMVRM